MHKNQHVKLIHGTYSLPVLCIAVFLGIWSQGKHFASELSLAEHLSLPSENFFFGLEQTFHPSQTALFYGWNADRDLVSSTRKDALPLLLVVPFYVLIALNYRKRWARSLFAGLTAYMMVNAYGLLRPRTFLDGSLAHEDHQHSMALPFILALIVCTTSGFSTRGGEVGRSLWHFGIVVLLITQVGSA